MIGFEYKYTTSYDVMNNIKLLTEYSIIEYSILSIGIFFLIISIYYIIPSLNIYYLFNKKESSKEERKKILKQIAMQKDINDEIEKELNI